MRGKSWDVILSPADPSKESDTIHILLLNNNDFRTAWKSKQSHSSTAESCDPH